MISFRTNDRAVIGIDGATEYVPWSAVCGNYKRGTDGINHPSGFQAVWNYQDGDSVYFNGTIGGITYEKTGRWTDHERNHFIKVKVWSDKTVCGSDGRENRFFVRQDRWCWHEKDSWLWWSPAFMLIPAEKIGETFQSRLDNPGLDYIDHYLLLNIQNVYYEGHDGKGGIVRTTHAL